MSGTPCARSASPTRRRSGASQTHKLTTMGHVQYSLPEGAILSVTNVTSLDVRTSKAPRDHVLQCLIAGETVIFRTHFHWWVLFWPSIIAILVGLPGLSSLSGVLVRGGSPGGSLILTVVGLGSLFTAAAIMAIALAEWKSTKAAVTNMRVIMRAGVFRTKVVCVTLSEVETVTVQQGIPGRVLGYGTIVLCEVGGSAERIRKIPHPARFSQSLQAQLQPMPAGRGEAPVV